jgi:hypothetical protein
VSTTGRKERELPTRKAGERKTPSRSACTFSKTLCLFCNRTSRSIIDEDEDVEEVEEVEDVEERDESFFLFLDLF